MCKCIYVYMCVYIHVCMMAMASLSRLSRMCPSIICKFTDQFIAETALELINSFPKVHRNIAQKLLINF